MLPRLGAIAVLFLAGFSCLGDTVALWTFNSVPPDADFTTGTLQPARGSGTALSVGDVTHSFTASNGSSDPAADNSNWRISGWPPQATQNKQNGVEFRVSTAGYRNLALRWDLRHSNTASKYVRLQYTTNGVDYLDYQVIVMPAEAWVNGQTASLTSLTGVENNPFFGLRFVTEFESTALGTGAAGYVTSNPGSQYGAGGTLRFDMVEITGDPAVETVSVLCYNILGNSATNWSPTFPQVQAIGRQLSYLRPDIVGFQEIPEAYWDQMDSFIATYLPGYNLRIGVRTDGGERSGVASRFPISRAQSWLARTNLSAFGYDGAFTRDLFEAEIAVPGFPQPLHVFNTHLKAHGDEVSATRRGAESRAVSNFLVTAFLPGKSNRPYLLMGDMNEDIFRPREFEQQAIQTLVSSPTGLRLTSPVNPLTDDERTWSIRNGNLSIRFDYILPSGLLFSNLTSSQVFRSDKVFPLLPPLEPGDSAAAADHLPIWMVFGNPYDSIPNNRPPDLAAIAHTFTQANSETNVALSVFDPDTPPESLMFHTVSSNGRLLPEGSMTIQGTGFTRSLRIKPAPEEAGAAWVTVTVTDGQAYSRASFMLQVSRPFPVATWTFNSLSADNNPATGTLLPSYGTGTALSVGSATNSINSDVGADSFDPNLTDNSKWRLASFPPQGSSNKTSGAEFRVSTAGYQNIALAWDQYNSASGSRYWRLQYALDGSNFVDHVVYTNPVETTWFPTGASFHDVPGADNNPKFAVRLVSEWESTATGSGAEQYRGTQATGGYTQVGTLWLDMVRFTGEILAPVLDIERMGQNARITWPSYHSGFTLQSRSAAASGSWGNRTEARLQADGREVVVITNLTGSQFFRLVR